MMETSPATTFATTLAPTMDEYYNEADDDGDSEQFLDNVTVTVIAVIVVLLILMTIGFEETHHKILHSSTSTTKPIVQAMFGELTVLGFLSLVTFCITQLGAFETISKSIMPTEEAEEGEAEEGESGEGGENELLEIFEQVHYMLFLIMIVFVASILVLVNSAKSLEQEWYLMDLACRSGEYMSRVISIQLQEQEQRQSSSSSASPTTLSWISFLCQHHSWVCRWCTRQTSSKSSSSSLQLNEDEFRRKLIVFYSISNEFKLDRNVKPSFEPNTSNNSSTSSSSSALPSDFHFGRYLSICLANTLTHVVSLEVSTWAFFGLLTAIYWGIMILVEDDIYIFAWLWVATGWLLLLFRSYFDYHIWTIIEQMIVPFSSSSTTSEATNESTTLLSNADQSGSLLPGWTTIDFDGPYGNYVTRQDVLYWRGRRGPKLYTSLYQIQLVFTSIYFSLLVLNFYPYFLSRMVWYELVIFVVLSLIPFVLSLSTFGRSAAGMTVICNIGVHRRPQTIAQVLREAKTDQVIRSVALMQKLSSAAADAAANSSSDHSHGHDHHNTNDNTASSTSHLTVDQQLELQNAKKCFHSMDKDQSGYLEVSELENLMVRLGFKVSDESLQAVLNLLDADDDSRVSETEFVGFYVKHIMKGSGGQDHHQQQHGHSDHHHRSGGHKGHHSVDHELHVLGKQIFEEFDADGSGEITLSEFKTILESLNAGFSIDELGDLVNEIDSSNDGTIGEHEFVSLLQKHRHLFEVHRLPDMSS